MLADTRATELANIKINEALHTPIMSVWPGSLIHSPSDKAMCKIKSVEGSGFHGGKVKVNLVNGRALFFNPTDYVANAPSMAAITFLTADIWKSFCELQK